MILSSVFHSVVSGPRPESLLLARWRLYRKTFATTEIAFPASVLRDPVVARWAREHQSAVDVRTSDEVATVIGVGIHPVRLTVHAAGVSAEELVFCAANLGVGRVVVDSLDHVELLAAVPPHRRQAVVVSMSNGFDAWAGRALVRAVQSRSRLSLVGLRGEIGVADRDFMSYPAAIGQLVSDMADIRRQHGVVLTRLGLAGPVPVTDGGQELAELATQIDETLDDACATLRFPRPSVVLTPGSAVTGLRAA